MRIPKSSENVYLLVLIMSQGFRMKLNKVMAVMVVSSALVLSGCSAMGTAIKKRNLGKNPDERNNLAGTFK